MPRGATAELLGLLSAFPRQALHATELKLAHPEDGREMEWKSPLPKDMRHLLEVLAQDRDGAGAA
jgi:23S rRNA pseudouridine1911/1915/1917 synthase